MKKTRFSDLLGQGLKFDWKITTLTIVSTLLILIDYYFTITAGNYFDSILLYILVPIGITLVIFRESPADYGFVIGDWKAGLIITLGGILLMTPVIWYLGIHTSAMRQYYQILPQGLIWKKALELFGWEYLFRGWLLFGYARKYGPDALWLQAVPFAIAHMGKPAIETLSTIFGGFAFGWVSWRTGSFLYAFLIHWFISAFIILVSASAVV
jgi:membrane protease YdiL (CAAX protease family)